VTDTLPEPAVPTAPGDWTAAPWAALGPPPIDVSPTTRPEYPPYWLVRRWNTTRLDEVGRSIVERAIYVSNNATHADHAAAVDVITDALCRWSHPDDIRWCHLSDAGGYTVVGSAIRAIGLAEGDELDDDQPHEADDRPA
jgi:hypothetical protein